MPETLTANRHKAERVKKVWFYGGLIFLSFCAFFFACLLGTAEMSLRGMFQSLPNLIVRQPETLQETLLQLRMTRALCAYATGASLALAGVMMQTLLRNHLADPYVLGISGGASVGALLSMMFLGFITVELGAFVGALAISFLLYFLAIRDKGVSFNGNISFLLLTGVILSSVCGALVTLILSISSDGNLRNMVFWLIGDLSGAKFSWLTWILLFIVLIFTRRFATALNLLVMHDENAQTFGVNVDFLRKALFLSAALLTAGAIVYVGNIGFIGLIIPHACRLLFGADHRLLLPSSVCVGGIFLVVADVLSRIILSPAEIPVGAITALIGAPVFLILLRQIYRK